MNLKFRYIFLLSAFLHSVSGFAVHLPSVYSRHLGFRGIHLSNGTIIERSLTSRVFLDLSEQFEPIENRALGRLVPRRSGYYLHQFVITGQSRFFF